MIERLQKNELNINDLVRALSPKNETEKKATAHSHSNPQKAHHDPVTNDRNLPFVRELKRLTL